MVNDRGTIKWTTMMLPEHATLLKKLWAEDEKQKKPILDVQQIEQLEYEIEAAYARNDLLELSIFKQATIQKRVGKIIGIDPIQKRVKFALQETNQIDFIPFDSILDAQIKQE